MKTEQKKSTESPLDPGYLMLAMYLLGVTGLMLFAWFGGSNGMREGEHNRDGIVVNGQMTGQVIGQVIGQVTDQVNAGQQGVSQSDEYGIVPVVAIETNLL